MPVISMFEMREHRRAAAAMMDGLRRRHSRASPSCVAALARLRAASARRDRDLYAEAARRRPAVDPCRSVVLVAGLLGAVGGFCLQSLCRRRSAIRSISAVGPNLSWPAFIPIAFEIGVLVAVLAGFVGFLVVNRLPRLYDPVDECAATARRHARSLVSCHPHRSARARAHALLRDLARRSRIEELPA